MSRFIQATVIAFFLTGCTADYARRHTSSVLASLALIEKHELHSGYGWILATNTHFYLTPAEVHDGDDMPRSQAALGRAVYSAFKRYFPNTAFAKNTVFSEPSQSTLASTSFSKPTSKPTLGSTFPRMTAAVSKHLHQARQYGADVLVVSKLLSVKNAVNTGLERNMAPRARSDVRRKGKDEMQLQLLLYEARTTKLLDIIYLKSISPMYHRGNPLPANLFAPALNKAVSFLAGKPQRG